MEGSSRKPSKEKEEEEEEEVRRRRRLSSSSNNGSTNSSPEFEFWMTRNPSSIPQPDQLLSADELFLDGVLLPLHLLHSHHHPITPTTSSLLLSPEKETPLAINTTTTTTNTTTSGSVGGSKRWKDMLFKKTVASAQDDERVKEGDRDKYKEKEKKEKKNVREKNKKNGGVSGQVSGTAELNIINIWPFSRSRSAGNGSTRPKLVPPGSTRKISSAPCSRSNSSGENKSGRKSPTSPCRVNAGVYLGRTSPVWQVRPNGLGSRAKSSGEKSGTGKKEFTEPWRGKIVCGNSDDGNNGSNKVKILNLNVPKCIGYRSHHLSCRSDANSALIVDSGGDLQGKNGDNDGGSGLIGSGTTAANLFNFRSLFTKKVY